MIGRVAMSRKERRQLEAKEREEQKNEGKWRQLTRERIDKAVTAEFAAKMDSARLQGGWEAMELFTHALAMALNRHFDFGKERITRVMEETDNQVKLIRDGYIKLDDLKRWAVEKGIEL